MLAVVDRSPGCRLTLTFAWREFPCATFRVRRRNALPGRTEHPSPAKVSAVARPIPLEAPVINAVFPANCRSKHPSRSRSHISDGGRIVYNCSVQVIQFAALQPGRSPCHSAATLLVTSPHMSVSPACGSPHGACPIRRAVQGRRQSPGALRRRNSGAGTARSLGANDRAWSHRTTRPATSFCAIPGPILSLPPVMVGSHIDSQPTGGKFDGPLGVLAGLESVEAIIAQRRAPAPIHRRGFLDE